MGFLKKLFKKETPFEGKLLKVEGSKADRVIELSDYAMINKIVVLVGNQEMIDIYKKRYEDIEVYGFAKNFTKHLEKIDAENGVLIDESVETDMVDYLRLSFPNIKIVGGYTKGE